MKTLKEILNNSHFESEWYAKFLTDDLENSKLTIECVSALLERLYYHIEELLFQDDNEDLETTRNFISFC